MSQSRKPRDKEQKKRYRLANRERISAYNKEYRARKIEEIRKREYAYNRENADKKKLYNAEYRKKHPEKYEYYYEKNRAKRIIVSSRHRHLRRLVTRETDITSEFLQELWKNSVFCVVCGKMMEENCNYPNGKELDHILPINAGGLHTMVNVRYICAKCNRSRPRDGRDINDSK